MMAVTHDVSYRDGGVGNGDGMMAAAAAPVHFMDFNCFIDKRAITDVTAVTDAMANMGVNASNTPKRRRAWTSAEHSRFLQASH